MNDVPAGPTPQHPPPPAVRGLAPEGVTNTTLLLDLLQLVARVEGTQIVMTQQLQDATASRRRLHEKVDEVREKAGEAARRAEVAVADAEKAIANAAALKPSVDDAVAMMGYVRVGLWALGLVIMPLLGLLGWGAMQAWQYIVAHLDLSRLWKQ